MTKTGCKINIPNPKEYAQLKEQERRIVAIVGNENKGKTFLLELLCGEKTPHSFHSHTKGISAKYIPNRGNFAGPLVLDTAGGSIPI